MMKRTLSIILLIILMLNILSAVGTTVSAATYSNGNFEYNISSGYVTIIKYTGTATTIQIPSEIDGYSVKRIGENAFRDCTEISRVTISSGVTEIGKCAFYQCTNLTHISFPEGITYIGMWAFYNCINLIDVELPDSITNIDDSAFLKCESLNSIKIPNKVTKIGFQTFTSCSNLKSIIIPDSVTEIGDAFENCFNLESVTFGKNVKTIEAFAFFHCTSLAEISLPDSVRTIGFRAFYDTAYYNEESNWKNDILYLGKFLIHAYNSELSQYTVNEGTLAIACRAFIGCNKLKEVILPYSLKSIGDGAFFSTGLTTAYVPEGLDIDVNNVFPAQTKIIYREYYTIHYDAAGGIGAPEDQTKNPEEALTIPNTIPSRVGHAFVGWSEKVSGTADYLPGKTYTVNKNMTLFAVWKTATTYTIRYNLNGGKGDFPDQIKIIGESLKLYTAKPTDEKHSFAYWISSDQVTIYRAGDTYTADANDTLYAVWAESCPTCHGSTYSSVKTCSVCDGSTYSDIYTCSACRGKGSIVNTYTCAKCKGTGKTIRTHQVTCSQCKGSGEYWGLGFSMTGYWGWQFLPCAYCNSTGEVTIKEEVTCSKCNGNKTITEKDKCTECQGEGKIKIKCEKCNGEGKIKTKCGQCNGKGFLYHYPHFEPIQYILGDADRDDSVTIVDATCIQRHIASIPVFAYNESAADTDGDGSVTILDATMIQRWLTGLKCPAGIGEPIS